MFEAIAHATASMPGGHEPSAAAQASGEAHSSTHARTHKFLPKPWISLLPWQSTLKGPAGDLCTALG